MPILRRRVRRSFPSSAVMSCPSIMILPSLGFSRRLTHRMSVLFPAPLIPMIPKISPSSMVRLISFKAVKSPLSVLKNFDRFLISIIMLLFLLLSGAGHFRTMPPGGPVCFRATPPDKPVYLSPTFIYFSVQTAKSQEIPVHWQFCACRITIHVLHLIKK
ncbi:hypothetical protein SDC9_161996 [bioreactor metagenome]|uniref:Uncharacterized protein n=1 Tax=bioreactor metagenome TaxID=1076179 RepID=A0A645FMV0_9ZZZZ